MSLHKDFRAQAMQVLPLGAGQARQQKLGSVFISVQNCLLWSGDTARATKPSADPSPHMSPCPPTTDKVACGQHGWLKPHVSATGGASPCLGLSGQCQCHVGWQQGAMWRAGASEPNRSWQAPCFTSPFISRSASAKSPNRALSRLLTFLQSILIR